MARKPKSSAARQPRPPRRAATSDRDKAVDALMALLAEHPSKRSAWPRSPAAPG